MSEFALIRQWALDSGLEGTPEWDAPSAALSRLEQRLAETETALHLAENKLTVSERVGQIQRRDDALREAETRLAQQEDALRQARTDVIAIALEGWDSTRGELGRATLDRLDAALNESIEASA